MFLKNFNFHKIKEGSKRFQHSTAVDHAGSQVHKTAFKFHIKGSWINARDQAAKLQVVLPKNQHCIVHEMSDINMKNIEYTKNKFETACFLAIEELLLTE